ALCQKVRAEHQHQAGERAHHDADAASLHARVRIASGSTKYESNTFDKVRLKPDPACTCASTCVGSAFGRTFSSLSLAVETVTQGSKKSRSTFSIEKSFLLIPLYLLRWGLWTPPLQWR